MTAGYRDSVLALGPRAFYTFDNDTAFDPVSRELISPFVTDDSGNGNTGEIHLVDDQGGGQSFGYAAGMISLIQREQYPQTSFCFGWRGFNPWGNLDQVHFPYAAYPKAFITLPSTIAKFEKNDGSKQPGSFTLLFHLQKDKRESEAGGLRTYFPPGADTIFRPIFAWEGILYLHYIEAEFANTFRHLCVTFAPGTGIFDKWVSLGGSNKNPGGDSAAIDANMPNTQGDYEWNGPINYTKDAKMIAITWKADNTGKKGQFSVFVDGEMMFSHKVENALSSQILHNIKNAKFYIGGFPYTYTQNDIPYVANLETPTSRVSTYGTLNAPLEFPDRATTPQYIDQLAIFDYALNKPQIYYLWMKTRTYRDSVLRLEPIVYLPMDEPSSAVDIKRYTDPNTTDPDVAFWNWDLSGSAQAGFEGPANIQHAGAVKFFGGALIAPSSSALSTRDFTIETWIKLDSTTTDRGVVFAWSAVDYPYYGGATLQVNWRQDVPLVGALQFNIDATTYICTRIGTSVTDGNWHHVVLIRKKNSLEMWVDGQKQGALYNITINNSTAKTYSQMHLGNQADGLIPFQGYLSNFALYAYALSGAQVKYHYYYNVKYRIRGNTVESGSAEPSDVRLLNHTDGELVDRIITDPLVADFEFNPTVSTQYDVFAIDPDFPTPHARAFGPLIPTTYPDTLPYRRFLDSGYFNPGSDGQGNN